MQMFRMVESCIDPNTLSQVLKGLELKHLIKREKGTDGLQKVHN